MGEAAILYFSRRREARLSGALSAARADHAAADAAARRSYAVAQANARRAREILDELDDALDERDALALRVADLERENGNLRRALDGVLDELGRAA